MNAVNSLPPNVSDPFVMLKPRSEWPNAEEPKSALVERMEEALLKVPGNNLGLLPLPSCYRENACHGLPLRLP
jgi:Cu/Ag efflux pump CusA